MLFELDSFKILASRATVDLGEVQGLVAGYLPIHRHHGREVDSTPD